MARTLTITDDEIGATASVRIEQDPQGHAVVKHLHFDALDGRGISAETLRLIEDLGLRLPDRSAAPAPERRRLGRPPKSAAAKAAAKAPARAPAERKRATKATPRQLPAADAEPARALEAAAPTPPPAVDPPAVDPPAVDPPAVDPPAVEADPPAAVPQPRKGRREGPPPSGDALAALFRRHHGDIAAIAAELGAARTTVGGWIRAAREAGTRITLDDVEPVFTAAP
jgi:hypothetical protein